MKLIDKIRSLENFGNIIELKFKNIDLRNIIDVLKIAKDLRQLNIDF